MAFADLAIRGADVFSALRVDVYVGTTLTYRWSNTPGKLDGTNEYEERVAKLGNITRGFGNDRVVAPVLTDLELRNEDGALDWLVSRSSMSGLGSGQGLPDVRFDVYLVLIPTASGLGGITSKQLGSFVLADWPRRDTNVVRCSLADDVLGGLAGGLLLPTMGDIRAAWEATKGGRLLLPNGMSPAQPLPMAFGSDWVQTTQGTIPTTGTAEATNADDLPRMIFWVCSAGLAVADVDRVVSEWWPVVERCAAKEPPESEGTRLPNRLEWAGRVVVADSVGSYFIDAVTAFSLSVSKNSKTWTCIGIEVTGAAAAAYRRDASTYSTVPITDTGGDFSLWFPLHSPIAEVFSQTDLDAIDTAAADVAFSPDFKTEMLGAVYNRRWWVRNNTAAHAADVVADLLDDYAQPAVSRDTTSFTRWKTNRPQALAAGTIGDALNLRDELTAIAQSFDVDFFVDWDGDFAVAYDHFDTLFVEVQTAVGSSAEQWTPSDALVIFGEEDLKGPVDELPGEFSRLRPVTHVQYADLAQKKNPISERQEFVTGSYINPSGERVSPTFAVVPFGGAATSEINPAKRVVVGKLHARWREMRQLVTPTAGIELRHIETHARPRFRFTTTLKGLLLDLGDFFAATWTRGHLTVYDQAYFQLERQTYHPDSDSVTLEGVWRANGDDVWPYLLDDETLQVIMDDAGGTNTATVTDSSITVTFSAGGLNAANVAAGDILWLLDSTLASDVFTRYRAIRIAGRVSDTDLELDSADLDFDAPGGVAVATWQIRPGAGTLAAWAAGNLVDYPNGSAMFGSVATASSSAGTYASIEPAHKLGNG